MIRNICWNALIFKQVVQDFSILVCIFIKKVTFAIFWRGYIFGWEDISILICIITCFYIWNLTFVTLWSKHRINLPLWFGRGLLNHRNRGHHITIISPLVVEILVFDLKVPMQLIKFIELFFIFVNKLTLIGILTSLFSYCCALGWKFIKVTRSRFYLLDSRSWFPLSLFFVKIKHMQLSVIGALLFYVFAVV